MRFEIVTTGYNCAEYVRACVRSVERQTYKGEWHCTAVVDGYAPQTGEYPHTDDTLLSLWNALDSDESLRFRVRHYPQNRGAALRRYEVISELKDEKTIIVLLGLDDELLPDALETIAEEYRLGKFMTYGNWVNQHGVGLPPDFPLEFDEATHATRDYRKVKYRSTAPNTFYKFLFDAIPEDDFKIRGEWLQTTTESEVMLSCLEMSGRDRIGVIRKPIYLYNQNLPNGTQRRLGQAYKNSIYSIIAARPKKQLYEDIKRM